MAKCPLLTLIARLFAAALEELREAEVADKVCHDATQDPDDEACGASIIGSVEGMTAIVADDLIDRPDSFRAFRVLFCFPLVRIEGSTLELTLEIYPPSLTLCSGHLLAVET